jgi:2-polyprenyl-6-methoxyphenol hydroxylase-like FAD-dependent oxidoreductase
MRNGAEPAGLVIIGGGIGGVATALALAQRGISAHVLEQSAELAEIGAGIQLGPNASRVLDRLGVLESISENAVFPPEAVLMDAVTGRCLTRLKFDERFIDSYGYRYLVTHRTDLHQSLVDACLATGQVTVGTSQRVTGLSQDDDGVRIDTAAGQAYRARAVIGADGLHSVVRQYVVGDGEPIVSRDVAYRGTLRYADVDEREGKDNMTWWIGPRMHLVQYPIRRRELFNQVAVFTTASAAGGSDDETRGGPAELDERFADKCEVVRRGAASILRDRRWVLVDREPVANWTKGSVTLLGDAAHPMLQYLGQGGCQALEDAVALAGALADAGGIDNARAAFGAYQQLRIPRTALTQRWARRLGEIVHSDGVTAFLRNQLLKHRSDEDLTYFDWLYADHALSDSASLAAAG